MMDENKTINMCVTHAGYKYIGHFRRGHLQIELEGNHCGCCVTLENEFDLVDLFGCFGIDAEDGRWLNDLVGKCCRVTFNENDKVAMIQHIVNDKLCWRNEKANEP